VNLRVGREAPVYDEGATRIICSTTPLRSGSLVVGARYVNFRRRRALHRAA
jgi:hypothetical protein